MLGGPLRGETPYRSPETGEQAAAIAGRGMAAAGGTNLSPRVGGTLGGPLRGAGARLYAPEGCGQGDGVLAVAMNSVLGVNHTRRREQLYGPLLGSILD